MSKRRRLRRANFHRHATTVRKAAWVVGGSILLLLVWWFTFARRSFPGPPHGALTAHQKEAIREAEIAVHELPDRKTVDE